MKNKIVLKFPKNKKAFSMIELSIVLLIIGIIFGSVIAGNKLVRISNLTKARTLTNSSPVAGVENLVLWLETTSKNSFTNASPNDGDFISTWNDINPQKTLKNNATQPGATTLQPAYVANGINGLPSIQFIAGKTNFFTINNTIGQMGMGSGEREFFIVFNDESASGNSVQLGTNIDNVYTMVHTYPTGIAIFNGTNLGVLKSALNGSNYILNGRINASNNATVSINKLGDDASASSPTNSAFNSSNNFYIGRTAQASPVYFFYGQMGEIIMYNRVLSSTERNDIKNYLSKKWGIKLS